MKIVITICATSLLLFPGIVLPVYAQHGEQHQPGQRQGPPPQQRQEPQRGIPQPQQQQQRRGQQGQAGPPFSQHQEQHQEQRQQEQHQQAGPRPPGWQMQQRQGGPQQQPGSPMQQRHGGPQQQQPQQPPPSRAPQWPLSPRPQPSQGPEQRRGGPHGHEQPGQPGGGGPQGRSFPPPQQRNPQQARAWQRQNGWRQPGAWQEHGSWQQHRASHWEADHRTWGQRGGYGGYYIPQDRFRVRFGNEHPFRLRARPTIYMGYPRFQYGGFSFLFVDPWPEYWSDDWYASDDVYVDYNDGYYLYNRRYPGVAIAITVVL